MKRTMSGAASIQKKVILLFLLLRGFYTELYVLFRDYKN